MSYSCKKHWMSATSILPNLHFNCKKQAQTVLNKVKIMEILSISRINHKVRRIHVKFVIWNTMFYVLGWSALNVIKKPKYEKWK